MHVGKYTIIGSKPRPLLGRDADFSSEDNLNGENIWIGSFCNIGMNVSIGAGTIISDGTFIEESVKIGSESLTAYRCTICSNVTIGNNCVIGGFIGENTKIGNRCRIFGDIVHEHLEPLKDWDAETSQEKGPTIHDNVFIGFGAIITKPVEIYNNSYILPNSIVSEDVPPFHIVKNKNEMIHFTKWKGNLSKSDFFKQED